MESFGNWLREKEKSDVDLKKVHDVVQSFRENRSKEVFEKLLDSPHIDKLSDSLVEFIRSDQSPMHVFWNSYIDMVNWLLLFIRSTRQANWDLHLACIQEMIPWVHAYDRINHARYLPLDWAQMKALPTSHPEANTYLQNGGFAVQRGHASPFSQIPIDQTIEKTINRDTKTKGGIVGFSLNRGAVQRWMLTAHERAAVTQNLKKMMGIKQSETSAMKEMRTARISRDESDVRKEVEVLETWINPFHPSEELSSVSSGAVASKDVEDELLGAKKIGENTAMAFMKLSFMTLSVRRN